MSSLGVALGDLTLANPVITASGTFGYGAEFADFVDLDRLGGIVVKGVSLYPSEGNPPPRIVETACGMLNSIGLENVGIDEFERSKLPFLRALACRRIVNIYGKTVDEYAALAGRLDGLDGVDAIEVNISCPNVKAGGMAFGVDAAAAAEVVSSVRARTSMHLMVKLSPNVSDITVIAKSVRDAGADSISLINTLAGMAIDINTRRPKLANMVGGLSGPAIKPVALRMVWEAVRAVDIPVVGIGGITSAQDALEFLIAGATAVQVGTANLINPAVTMDIIDGIKGFMEERGIGDINEIIGTLET